MKIDFSGHPDAMPDGLYIEDSDIHGKGLFTEELRLAEEQVVLSHVVWPSSGRWLRTAAGAFINHSSTPNCILMDNKRGSVQIVAIYMIIPDTELTVDYTKYPCGLGIKMIKK